MTATASIAARRQFAGATAVAPRESVSRGAECAPVQTQRGELLIFRIQRQKQKEYESSIIHIIPVVQNSTPSV